MEVQLSNPTGATILDGVSDIVILNDDTAVLPTLSIADLDITEGDTGTKIAQAVVTLSEASNETVTVEYTTVDETTTAGVDYITASGTLTFTPGQTTANIEVTINGDTDVEVDEIMEVQLSNPTGAIILDGVSDIVILNDDSATTTAWQNSTDPLDVDDDGIVVPLDVLLVINRLNQVGSGPLPEPTNEVAPPPFYDVNGDGFVSPIDALLIINHLNNPTAVAAVAATLSASDIASATDAAFSDDDVATDVDLALIAGATADKVEQ